MKLIIVSMMKLNIATSSKGWFKYIVPWERNQSIKCEEIIDLLNLTFGARSRDVKEGQATWLIRKLGSNFSVTPSYTRQY